MEDTLPTTLIGLTTQIVSAHVSHNSVPSDQLPALIKQVYDTLDNVARGPTVPEVQEPAVPFKSAIKADTITCLDCGKSLKTLKRHLMTEHAITPDQYRERWHLSYNYPMVASAYAKTRSSLAKKLGLGTRAIRNTRRRKGMIR